jgi:hypothetical protein
MSKKPSLEAVVVIAISLVTVGMTVAALVAPVPEQPGMTATPVPRPDAPAAPIKAATPRPIAGPERLRASCRGAAEAQPPCPLLSGPHCSGTGAAPGLVRE